MDNIVLFSLMNWFHLMATVIWIGGVTTIFLLVHPVASKTLDPSSAGKIMMGITKRMRSYVYLCIVLFIGTGIVMQMMDANYVGLNLKDSWTLILLIKHFLTVIFIIIAIYIFQGLMPKMMKLSEKGPSPEMLKLQKKQFGFGFTNLIIAWIILLLTAISTAIQ